MASPTPERRPIPPLVAKTIAAATGGTMTALTMTPFDVIKTRLQTQPIEPIASSSTPLTTVAKNAAAACCQPSGAPCVRQYSTLTIPASTSGTTRIDSRAYFRANSLPTEVVCLWDKEGHVRSERVTGFWDAGAKVFKAEGIRGLWKGVGTTLVMAVPNATIYMVTYDTLRNALPMHSHYALLSPLASGIVARTIVSSLSSPVELFRTRLQANPLDGVPHTTRSVLTGIRAMVKQQGVTSLYKGLGPTLWRDVPFSGMYWAGYEAIKSRLKSRGYEGNSVAFASGAISGTLSAFVTSPFDVLKTRRQALLNAVVSSPGTKAPSTSTIPLIQHMIRTEGVRSLYAGLTPRLAKIAPACGIMISCYEGVGKWLHIQINS